MSCRVIEAVDVSVFPLPSWRGSEKARRTHSLTSKKSNGENLQDFLLPAISLRFYKCAYESVLKPLQTICARLISVNTKSEKEQRNPTSQTLKFKYIKP